MEERGGESGGLLAASRVRQGFFTPTNGQEICFRVGFLSLGFPLRSVFGFGEQRIKGFARISLFGLQSSSFFFLFRGERKRSPFLVESVLWFFSCFSSNREMREGLGNLIQAT